jgi:uncharacterized protein
MGRSSSDASAGVPVGVVSSLWRYPVKSMAAEALTSASLSWHGFAGDRRWAFVRPESGLNGFPWHTIRENPSMCNYVPRLVDPDRPDKSAVEVTAPDGRVYELADPELVGQLGAGLRLMRLNRGLFDAMPLSLITASTVSALCGLAGIPAAELRFRPNLVVTPASGAPYTEEEWVGRQLRVGEAIIRIDRRDSRCVIVNVDPATGRPDAAMLKIVGSCNDACAGVYGTPVAPGVVGVGDPVILVP